MSGKATVSIAMATYNGDKYLREQLASLAAQTRLPDELVITDDGSTDRTTEIATKFANTAPFKVTILRNKENLGYARNFERAVKHCSGQIIFLCDQDDIWLGQKIETIVELFNANSQIMAIVHDASIINGLGVQVGRSKFSAMRKQGVLRRNYLAGCLSAHRREWSELALPLPRDLEDLPITLHGHDTWINGLAHTCDVVLIVDKVLMKYRRHDKNHSAGAQISQVSLRSKLFTRTSGNLTLWLEEARLHKLFEQRLTEILHTDTPGYRIIAMHGISNARRLSNALHLRYAASKEMGLRRIATVLKLWVAQDYRCFWRGTMSALKDVVR